MPSTPLICSSIGVDTVSAMTWGLAPGYGARTTTVGGATSGYSEIGSAGSDNNPATKISVDKTPAKIGRSMQNVDKFMALARQYRRVRSATVPARSTVIGPTDDFCRVRDAGAVLRKAPRSGYWRC